MPLLQTLRERGYLSQKPRTVRYRLGTRAHLLGEAARGSMDLLAIGAEALGRLQSATRQTAVLSRVIGRTVTVLNTITGPSALEIGVRPGSDLSLHATAQGRSEEHTSELQPLMRISNAVFCLKKKI